MLTRWSPFRDIVSLQNDINHAFRKMENTMADDEDGALFRTSGNWHPPADVYEDAEGIIADFEVPGIDPKDVEIKVENNMFTLKGERAFEKKVDKKSYYRVERSYGTFSRSFNIPKNVDVNKIKAQSKHGVLSVFFPKLPEAKPKTISIDVQDME